MSKIYYDHLIVFEELEVEVNKAARSQEEKEELWKLIDEILHLRILSRILDNLPSQHHQEFLDRLHASPYDERLINFLNERVNKDIEEFLRKEIKDLEREIIESIKGKKK